VGSCEKRNEPSISISTKHGEFFDQLRNY